MSAQAVREPAPLGLDGHLPIPPHSPSEIEQLTDDSDLSPDPADDDGVEDQDDAQAVMQPAISAPARHLTSCQTPAAEKAAALDKLTGGGLFDLIPDEDAEGEVTPPVTEKAAKPSLHLDQLPGASASPPKPSLPSPWQSSARKPQPSNKNNRNRMRPSRNVLESAFGPTRSRSHSAGQEALRKLREALPSLPSTNHRLPSLSGSFSFFSDKSASSGGSTPNRTSPPSSTTTLPGSTAPGVISQAPRPQTRVQRRTSAIRESGEPLPQRPPILRRVTSDESLLYHSLSRASSLGNDDQFQDVRAMVNMRLMAFKDSLPEVPNFKMPSLPKMPYTAKKPFLSLNSLHSTQEPNQTASPLEQETNTTLPTREGSMALEHALNELTGDIVLLGGLRGSILRSAEPPHQQLWAPVKLGLNMRKVNLEVGLNDEDEERMEETIKPSGMLSHIGPIDMSRKLLKKMRHCHNVRTGKLRIHDYGWDWRLSPAIASKKFQDFLQTLPSNRPGVAPEARGALVLAHSLGGLVTRHAVNQRPELFSGVLYAGVPQRCINILGPLRNGDVVLLNEKLLTAAVQFSMRTSFVFLPEDGFCFLNKDTGEEYPIDFYDADEWIKWRLSPCMNLPLPAYHPPKDTSTLSSLLPTALRGRSDSNRAEKAFKEAAAQTAAPNMNTGTEGQTTASSDPLSTMEHMKYKEYLTRTLAATRKFRSELQHNESHQEANTYPPLAVLYGKTIPTVHSVHVSSPEVIPCTDCYDDLLFRAGDGVVLAKEAQLPDGYNIVRGGRVSTERGHITMMGDMVAMAQALGALTRGRKKGIGLGVTQGVADRSAKTP